MNRRQLEHVIREVGRRTEQEYFYIIGSASVLATMPDVTDAALVGTRDVDVLPAPEDQSKADALADRLDWLLGEGSEFELEYGYYVQGVSRTTPTYAPRGWQMRAVPVKVDSYTGLCMEIHDLALSKYGAGREKDLLFTRTLVRTGMLNKEELLARLKDVTADDTVDSLIRSRIEVDFKR